MNFKTFLIDNKYKIACCILLSWIIFWTFYLLTPFLTEPIEIDPDSPEGKYQFESNIYSVFGRNGSLFFFTVQLNWLVSIFYIGKSFKFKWANKNNEAALTTWVLLMLLVYWIGIAPYRTWGQRPFADSSEVIVHFIVPTVVFALYKFNKEEITDNKKTKWIRTFSYPIVYFVFASLVYFVTNGDGVIYLFIKFYDPMNLGFKNIAGIFFINIFIILFILTIIFLIRWCLDKLEKKVLI